MFKSQSNTKTLGDPDGLPVPHQIDKPLLPQGEFVLHLGKFKKHISTNSTYKYKYIQTQTMIGKMTN